MSKELFVFDYDGTWTDPVATHEAYTDIFESEFANRTGLPRDIVAKYIQPEREELIACPEIYGWTNIQGFIVAPATFDTYILNRISAQKAVEKMRASNERGLPDPGEVVDFLNILHHYSYPKSGVSYRPGSIYAMKELIALGKLVIVSGSKSEEVLAKLQPFLRNNRISNDNIEVIGNARKHLINPYWNRTPWSMHLLGLETREVLLRRAHYGDIILSLGKSPNVIVGDSGEFDLVTPHILQMKTMLITSSFTPIWEENFFRTENSLEGIVNQIITDLDN